MAKTHHIHIHVHDFEPGTKPVTRAESEQMVKRAIGGGGGKSPPPKSPQNGPGEGPKKPKKPQKPTPTRRGKVGLTRLELEDNRAVAKHLHRSKKEGKRGNVTLWNETKPASREGMAVQRSAAHIGQAFKHRAAGHTKQYQQAERLARKAHRQSEIKRNFGEA